VAGISGIIHTNYFGSNVSACGCDEEERFSSGVLLLLNAVVVTI
jgi:hypothetical protein